MKNYGINVNLSLLNGVQIAKIGKEKNIVIPINQNFIWEGKKGLYLQLVAHELQNPQFEQSHYITLNIPKDEYERLTEEQRKNTKIIGNLKPIISRSIAEDLPQIELQGLKPASPSKPPTQTPVKQTLKPNITEDEEDLPF